MTNLGEERGVVVGGAGRGQVKLTMCVCMREGRVEGGVYIWQVHIAKKLTLILSLAQLHSLHKSSFLRRLEVNKEQWCRRYVKGTVKIKF